MPSFKIIGLLVLEKKIVKGFYHIWAWRPSRLCDQDHLYILLFHLPKELPHKFGFDWPSGCEEIFENGGRTDTRARVYYKLTS